MRGAFGNGKSLARPGLFAALSASGAVLVFILFVVEAPHREAWWPLAGAAVLAIVSIYLIRVDRRRFGKPGPSGRPKWLAMLLAACAVLSLLVLIFNLMPAAPRPGDEGAGGIWVWAAIAVFFAIASALLFRRVGRRKSGKRKPLIRRRWLGALAAVGAVLVLGIHIYYRSSVGHPQLIPFVALLAAYSIYCFKADRRLRAEPEVLEPRADYVLYLRSFTQETESFASGPERRMKKYTNKVSFSALNPNNYDPWMEVTLDDYLKAAISTRLGRFVALGNPTDRLPADGALREYAPDSAWTERYLELAAEAKCLLVAIGQSVNLHWELEQIRQIGLSSKLFVLTRPRPFHDDARTVLSTDERMRKGRVNEWDAFCGMLTHAGFGPALPYPGPGSVVTIDSSLEPMVLTTDAALPEHFIIPIADWIDRKAKTGRCVKGTCLSCGQDFYYPLSSENDPRICLPCKLREQLADLRGLDRLWSFAWFKLAYIGLFSLVAFPTLDHFNLLKKGYDQIIVLFTLLLAGIPVLVAFALQRLIRTIRRRHGGSPRS